MQPTTVTTIVLIALALAALTMAAVAWFGSWQPVVRRYADPELEAEYQQAVSEMRRVIAEYERGERTL